MRPNGGRSVLFDAGTESEPSDAFAPSRDELPRPDASPEAVDADPGPGMGESDAEVPDATPPGDPCEETLCDECYVCMDGECVPDDRLLGVDEPVCGTLCATWPNRCAAITAFHTPMRAGACFEQGAQALCEGTRGRWVIACGPKSCGTWAEGVEGDCAEDCTFACDCGNGRFDPEQGCVPDPGCFEPTDCRAEAACAGAWRREGVCVSPTGESVNEACCAELVCGEEVAFADPVSGVCVTGQEGCSVPPVAPRCDAPGDRVCDVGVFAIGGAWPDLRSGVCINQERFANRTAGISLEGRNYTEQPLSFDVVDQCPAGEALWAGLPEGHDPYDVCMAGPCERTGMPKTVSLDPQGASTISPWARVSAVETDCNAPVPEGRYTLTATLPLVEGAVVQLCDFTWLQLDVAAPPMP